MTETAGAALALSADFKGTTISPDDPGYDAARAVYNGSIDRRPALIVRPTGAADVMDAVNYAREAGLPLAVRCGGHAVAGTSVCDDGVLIDLSSLKGVHVDPVHGLATAEAGVLWGEYDREVLLWGKATPGGRVTTTGVGGFTLGGGYAWMSGMYGLTCDNLVAADLVIADGSFVHANEEENPDLLWALRGAGANFGVVTSYTFKVYPMPPLILAGMLIAPNDENAAARMRAWRDYADRAPRELGMAAATVLAPPEPFVPPELVGTPMVGIVAGWMAAPDDAAQEAFATLREIMDGGMDLTQPMPYTAFQAMLDGFAPKGWFNYHRGQHLSRLSDGVIDDFLAVGRDIGSPMTQGIIFRTGGAVNDVPEDATAAGNRAAEYMAHPIACWASPDEEAHELDWVRRFSEAFAPDLTGGVYLNFEPGVSREDLTAGYGAEKYARLAELKRIWDPGNLFRSNHNIVPAD